MNRQGHLQDALPWPGNGALSRDEAHQSLLRHPGLQHALLEDAGSGDFCQAFRQGKQIFRVARHFQAAVALRREARVLERIRGLLPVPVPQLRFHQSTDGPPFTIHPALEGALLTRESWLALPAAAQSRAASDLAAFLCSLHSLPESLVEDCGLERLQGARLAREVLEGPRTVFGKLLDESEQAFFFQCLEKWLEPAFQPGPGLSLLHADLAPGHVLMDSTSGAITGIIDFGDVCWGEPARDFVYIDEDFGPELLEAVLAHGPWESPSSLLRRIRMWGLLGCAHWLQSEWKTEPTAELEQEGKRELSRLMGLLKSLE